MKAQSKYSNRQHACMIHLKYYIAGNINFGEMALS